MIRTATPADAAAIAALYNHYVLNTCVTFEETAVPEVEMAGRISELLGVGFPWFVWEEDARLLGYCYANKWKARGAYRHTAEATVYLDRTATGRGLGTQLYTALIAHLREQKIHCVIGGVALPNPASVALHEKLGFQKVAQFREVGRKFQQWIDVAYWELILR